MKKDTELVFSHLVSYLNWNYDTKFNKKIDRTIFFNSIKNVNFK